MKLKKLDLHTHLYEATRCEIPDRKLLDRILDQGKQGGLDGIGITEHWDWEFGKRLVELKEEFYPLDEFLLIPGREIEIGKTHIVEILLPGNHPFRFLAHPGYRSSVYGDGRVIPDDIAGIELANSMHTVLEHRAGEIALEHGLVVLRNSDAHYMSDVGRYFSELLWNEDERRWLGFGADQQLIPINGRSWKP